MRTIAEIKREMQTAFMGDVGLAKAYGFPVGDSFNSHFGAASIEGLLLYVVACAIYVLEALHFQHRKEVAAQIDEMVVHRPKWYRDKALAFMKDKPLPTDRDGSIISDTYDTTGMSDGDIETAHVVKYAAATESTDSSLLTIKVAGGNGGDLHPLDEDVAVQLAAYFAEIKDAGVRIDIVNKAADRFCCTVDVYYDAMMTPSNVQSACAKAIAAYISNLPFNGEYTNMALVDALQAVSGVKVVEFVSSTVMVDGETTPTAINARHRPTAGYMQVDTLTINMRAYNEQV